MFKFLAIVKITTYYLIPDRQLVGPLNQACPLLWLKPLITPLVRVELGRNFAYCVLGQGT